METSQMTAEHQTDHPPCRSCYAYRGCRCVDCVREIRRYHKKWKMEKAAGRSRLVDAKAARERAQMLIDHGMTVKGIARDAGLGQASIRDLVRERSDGRLTAKLMRKTEAAIMAVKFRPGPNGSLPAVGASRRLRDLALRGYSTAELAAEAGLSIDTVARARRGEWEFVRAELHETVKALYARLYLLPPTVTDVAQQGRIRRLAQGKGWVPLAKYDNPDDPFEVRWSRKAG